MSNDRSAAAQWLHDGVRAIARSFRLHRPRGAFCHRGWCQQCKVEGPGGEVRLACHESASSGCKPSRGVDPLRAIGMFAENLPPWFWERQAYRPGPMRQVFLEIIRRLSAAPRLPVSVMPEQPVATRRLECEVLVVGGGLSGLVAAVTLAEKGRNVILVNAGRLGGSALARPGGPSEVAPWIRRASEKVRVHDHTLCLGLYEGGTSAWCTGKPDNMVIAFETLIVATGAYDKLPTVEGNDSPGLIGLRGFEHLVAVGAIPAGLRVGAYGTEVEIDRAVAAAVARGVTLAFVAGPGRVVSAQFPTHADVGLARIKAGDGGIKEVELSDGRRLACDLLVVCESQPTYELQAQAGAPMGLRGRIATLCALGGETAPLVVGEAAGWFNPAVSADRTREEISHWMETKRKPSMAPWMDNESTDLPNLPPEAFVCVCEDVRVRDIYHAIADGYTDIELVKRHTGAGTGPCQGKLCHGPMLQCAAKAGLDVRIPTPRPLVRPVMLHQLVPSHGQPK